MTVAGSVRDQRNADPAAQHQDREAMEGSELDQAGLTGQSRQGDRPAG
jgi:hypothetical protein